MIGGIAAYNAWNSSSDDADAEAEAEEHRLKEQAKLDAEARAAEKAAEAAKLEALQAEEQHVDELRGEYRERLAHAAALEGCADFDHWSL